MIINTMLNAAFLFWWGYDGELQKFYFNMSIPKRQLERVMVLIQQGEQHPGPQLDGLLLTNLMEGGDY